MQIASLSRSLQGQWQRLRQAVVRPSATGDVSSQDATPAMSRREKAQVSLGEKIAQDRQALYDKLGQMDRNSGLRNSRQSARDKVAMLRERVRMLKAQIAGAHGATLKRLARQLAQVAAQLKQAVSQYAGATSKLSTPSPAAPASAAPGAAVSANAQASPTATVDAASAAPPPSAESVTSIAAASAQPVTEAVLSDATQPATAESRDDASHKEMHAAREREQAKTDEKMDKAFAKEVKDLLRELKQAAELLKRRMRHAQQSAALAELERSLRAIEGQLARLQSGSQSGGEPTTGMPTATAGVNTTSVDAVDVGVATSVDVGGGATAGSGAVSAGTGA